jgi:polyhydroxyalkanoate synthesis regulator phasin
MAESDGPDQETEEDVRARLAALHDRLLQSLTLPVDRLQEAADDAVRRGRMTRRDAEELVASLVSAGRSQTEAIVSDIEQLLGVGAARSRVRRGGEAVLRSVDQVRKAVTPSGGFPIDGYDDLTAAKITSRLSELTPAELRKVRDYESRNANRKSVLAAVDRALK